MRYQGVGVCCRFGEAEPCGAQPPWVIFGALGLAEGLLGLCYVFFCTMSEANSAALVGGGIGG